jgi:hypothetical protein
MLGEWVTNCTSACASGYGKKGVLAENAKEELQAVAAVTQHFVTPQLPAKATSGGRGVTSANTYAVFGIFISETALTSKDHFPDRIFLRSSDKA